jgi:hypothetical protein
MGDRWNANGPGGLFNMTSIWLPIVPPASNASNASNLPAGTALNLMNCNASDPLQVFSISGGAVRHVASGLCVSAVTSNSGPLTLEACGGAAQGWTPQADGSLTSTPSESANGCFAINNANSLVSVGNPVYAWECSAPAVWNSR